MRAGMTQRITELDGLRAVAILGVLFAHVWSFGCGAPPLLAFGVDLNRMLSVFGTGVDLFFVVSGLCMHSMLVSKGPQHGIKNYLLFLLGRAKRIYPAYLAAIVFSAGVWFFISGRWATREVVAHLAFAQTLVPNATRLASPFWSLATEWHFYMVLPLLLWCGEKWGERLMLWSVFLLSIGCRALALSFPHAPIELNMLLPLRICEFVLGAAISSKHLRGDPLPFLFHGAKGAFLGLLVMLAGRALMTARVEHVGGLVSGLAMTLNIPLLAVGYAIIVWSVIASDSIVARALRTRPMLWLGRVSYSFYLWHWFPALWIGAYLTTSFGSKGFVPLLASLVSTAVIAPLSAVSYRLFEAPYFARRPAPTQAEDNNKPNASVNR